MKIINFLYILLVLQLSCMKKDSGFLHDLKPDYLLDKETKDEVFRKFEKYDKKYLNEQESCFFGIYVNDLMDSLDQDYSQVSNGIIYKSKFDPLSRFSFALLRNVGSEEYHYYGLSDIYQIRFLQTDYYKNKDSIKNIELNTSSLNGLVSNLFRDRSLTKPEIVNFLFNLYNDKIHKVNRPIFTSLVEKDNLLSMSSWIINNSVYKDLLEWDYEHVLFFELETKGLIIFTFESESDSISFKEYYVPPIEQLWYDKSDAIPYYYKEKCK